ACGPRMADIRDSALFAGATQPIVIRRCRQLDRCSSQASIAMQPAVPLWKVIADFGRRELQPGPQGPGFFASRAGDENSGKPRRMRIFLSFVAEDPRQPERDGGK